MISKREEEEARLDAAREAKARMELLQQDEEEATINVNGVPVPLSMAAAAVARCIRAIQITDTLIKQGFASADELEALKAGLTGEDVDKTGTKDAPVEL